MLGDNAQYFYYPVRDERHLVVCVRNFSADLFLFTGIWVDDFVDSEKRKQ